MAIYLYLKTHQVTGLKYLGKTKMDPYKYKGSGTEWMKHLRVYGNDVVTEVIRECATSKELTKWGKYYSVIFDVVNSPEFLNRIPETGGGGELSEETKRRMSESQKGRTHSEETKRKLSELNKGNKNCLGRKHSEETKRKISEAGKGKNLGQVPWNKGKTGVQTYSEETKRKISEANKGRKLSEEHKRKLSEAGKDNKNFLGKKHSEESKRKMSEAFKGRVPWNKGKRYTLGCTSTQSLESLWI